MGVIKPPWITKDWFLKCPFNYCDHFGDKQILARICKICREEGEREKAYLARGEDPHEIKNVFRDLAESLTQTMQMVVQQAKKMGIDLNALPEAEVGEFHPEKYPIYHLAQKYSDKVERAIEDLSLVPQITDAELLGKAVDALAHSRSYVGAKIRRALWSRWEDRFDLDNEIHDDKTSALLAYVAVERNTRALMVLAKHKPLRLLKKKHLHLAKVSLDLLALIRLEFFPGDKLEYEELGGVTFD